MTLNERIIDFIDGSLPAEDEAELLHTLSVSPEKRDVMHGFMEQRSLIARDAQTLTVPYETEQRLWARMDEVLPLAPAEEPTTVIVPVPTSNLGFLARAFTGASAAIRTVTLVAGIGIGYYAGHSNPAPVATSRAVAPIAPNFVANTAPATTYQSYGTHISRRTYDASTVHAAFSEPLQVTNSPQAAPISKDIQTPITPVAPTASPAISLANIGGDGVGIKPLLHETPSLRHENASFLSRFEFRVDESFGRQFPNTTATNVSLPIITNSSITTFFQVLPESNLFWAGASYGSANITRKNLFTQAGDPIDPSEDVLASDTVHSQTTYVAALAELRFPAFETANLTLTGGYGFATLGQMMFGEIGLHYDISSQAGIQCGLRVLRFVYDLSSEKSAAIASGNGSLAISNGAAAASPSFNTELNAGLFFHF